MNAVRLGVIGLGNMGQFHIKNIRDDKVTRCAVTAVCDQNPDRLAAFPDVQTFTKSQQLITSGLVDAVLVVTPHYDHTPTGIMALETGLHVLIEKPISVHKADGERLLAAHCNPRQVFAAMFNQRTDPFYRKIRELIRAGTLGEVRRVNWIITNWFRTEAYYASGGWRATWAGEGGGVLLNQSPHNIDLFQWLFGMPARVRANCHFGKFHNIEVEDEVTAYFEYPNGATGVFITSTGEAPGTNRLEVTAENGKLVYENDTLTFWKNEIPMSEFSRTTKESFASPPRQEIKFDITGRGGQHVEVLQNFIDAILDGQPLIAPAAEGLHSVELANAMLYSSLENRTIELPLDGAAYEARLKQLIAGSQFHKPVVTPSTNTNMGNSFAR